ncbi:hypothetical protein RP20_CCG021460 [Aedes albopictus]|nr:hypothetical protein RP20_CCG021460 [Aedes albopictus]
MSAGNKKFNIPIYMEDTAINVRIHDLPPGIPNAVVAEHMKEYGKVVSVARELWKKFFVGIPNGVRVVRIELNTHIPSFIKIQNQLTTVSYRSQIPTCRQCERKAHPNLKCSEAAAKQKQDIETMTQPCNLQSDQRKRQPTNAVADNPTKMDLTIEKEQCTSSQQQPKRNACQLSSTEVRSPPRKKASTVPPNKCDALCETNDDDNGDEREAMNTADTDTDSDSGPDPARDDVDGWLLKFSKRSKRQDKLIAKYCNRSKK